jgi:hypothetical protein
MTRCVATCPDDAELEKPYTPLAAEHPGAAAISNGLERSQRIRAAPMFETQRASVFAFRTSVTGFFERGILKFVFSVDSYSKVSITYEESHEISRS